MSRQGGHLHCQIRHTKRYVSHGVEGTRKGGGGYCQQGGDLVLHDGRLLFGDESQAKYGVPLVFRLLAAHLPLDEGDKGLQVGHGGAHLLHHVSHQTCARIVESYADEAIAVACAGKGRGGSSR